MTVAIEGRLKVWWIRNPPSKPFRIDVESPKAARQVLEALVAYDIFCDVESNAGGLEVFRDGEWEEWESEGGDDVWAD